MVITIYDFGSSYEEVMDRILEYISDNHFKSGDVLGNSNEVKELLNVSLNDVDDALSELCNDGFIEYNSDLSVYCIPEKRIEFNISKIRSFTKYITKQNFNTHSKVLQFNVVACPKTLSQTLNISFGSQIYILKRLRLVNNIPLAIEVSYIPCSLLPNLLKYDFSKESFFDVIKENYNIFPKSRNVNYEILQPTFEEIELLKITKPNTAMWNISGTTISTTGTIIEYAITRMSALSAYYCSNPNVNTKMPLKFKL